MQVPHFPPSAELVHLWPDGRKFAMYVSQLAISFQMLGVATRRMTPSVLGATNGLADANGWIRKFDTTTTWIPNFVVGRSSRIPWTLSLGSSCISPLYLFIAAHLEIPSQASPLDVHPGKKHPNAQKSFVWMRTTAGGAPRLILAMGKRKYFRGSVPRLRPAFVRPTPSSRTDSVLYMNIGRAV